MKHLLLVLLVVACKDDKPAAPPPAPTPPPPPAADAAPAAPAVLDACAIGRAALADAKCPTPEIDQQLAQARKSIDGIVDAIRQLGAGNPQQLQVACAQLLLAIERDAAKAKCTIALDPARRAEVVQMLEAWYARRTPVTPTGHAAADAVIAKIVAVRDAACECEDAACLDRVNKQLGGVGTMPADAPQTARDLGTQLLEDAARCAARVRTLTDPR